MLWKSRALHCQSMRCEVQRNELPRYNMQEVHGLHHTTLIYYVFVNWIRTYTIMSGCKPSCTGWGVYLQGGQLSELLVAAVGHATSIWVTFLLGAHQPLKPWCPYLLEFWAYILFLFLYCDVILFSLSHLTLTSFLCYSRSVKRLGLSQPP